MSIGMKAYVRELVTRLPGLAPDLQFLILSNEMLSVPAGNVRFDRVAAAVASNGGLGEQFFYARQLRTGGVDLIHYMSVYAPRQSPQAHRTPWPQAPKVRTPHIVMVAQRWCSRRRVR